jgi:hypothetical protein
MVTISNEQIRFDGHALFLSENADVIERQLRGEDIALSEALPLRALVAMHPKADLVCPL